MASLYKLVHTPEACTPRQSSLIAVNWTMCILCQAVISSEPLICPANTKRKDVGAGYADLAANLLRFHDINALPFEMDIQQLDTGSGIEATLREHKASWHKSCKNKVSTMKLDRILKRQTEELQGVSPVKTRRTSTELKQNEQEINVCIFCDNAPGPSGFHRASTMDIDFKVRKCAAELQDTTLLAKLAGGDMVAIDAHYHINCLSKLYKRAKSLNHDKEPSQSSHDESLHGLAFAELVSYLETFRYSEETKPIFTMSTLREIYCSKLHDYGLEDVNVHTTRLKKRILAAIPDLRVHTKGKQIFLAFDKDIGGALEKACDVDFDSEALTLAKAAKIIRRDINDMRNSFSGRFLENCQQDSVPPSLNALMSMIMNGPDVKQKVEDDKPHCRASLTISQLLLFNSMKDARTNISQLHRHNKDRETPLPIYLALKIHGETRKRGLIDTLYGMGLCISYDRVLEISTEVGNRVCAMYDKEQVVCPPQLLRDVFTTSAVDNIDHNPSSTTAKDSFHGTSISIMQHPRNEAQGTARNLPLFDGKQRETKAIAALPVSYTHVPPSTPTRHNIVVPHTVGPVRPDDPDIKETLQREFEWLYHVKQVLELPELNAEDVISWSAYHASLQPPLQDPTTVLALMPLFLESAHTVAMIQHSMNVIMRAVQHLNPGQVPVIAMDQPLFAIAKTIQWSFPETHGEDKFLIMMGGLHIEMAVLKTLGDWLEGSGWTTAIYNAGIASFGVADSMIKATHVTRTRHAHQITAATLFILRQQAFDAYKCSVQNDNVDFTWWCQAMSNKPQFQYWTLVLELELCMLRLVGSIREGDFENFIKSVVQIIPWMFSLDHINYARWLSVHIRDLSSLPVKHPALNQAFCLGGFVAHKTKRSFSSMSLDQAHEQHNAQVKGEGGAVGLTENPAALRRWLVAGPEISRMVDEFEASSQTKESTLHHEQTAGVQASFAKEVEAMTSALNEMGNPFKEDSYDLLTLDTKRIMDAEVVETVQQIQTRGREQYNNFVTERFIMCTKSISDPIKKNNMPLFSKKIVHSKQQSQVATLKDDCALFSRLYIACQSREGNLEEFFRYENQPWPPSLAKQNEMRSGNKADLLSQLEPLATSPETVPKVSAALLDGAMVVQMVGPDTSKTFQDYYETAFQPYIELLLQHVDRLDVVWDVYMQNSLKTSTREKRGTGLRRRVVPTSTVPSNWKSFLRDNDNKTELFQLLSEQLTSKEVIGKELYSTCGKQVLCTPPRQNKSRIEPCSHEEADTRLILHVCDAAEHGHKKVMVRTADTDVVIILISNFHNIPATEVWLSFGVGKNHRYIAAHEIACTLGPQKSKALGMFHALTGCDVTSFFYGKGKRSAWDTWLVFPELTNALLALSQAPDHVDETDMAEIERFVVLWYDRTSELLSVNEARKQLFSSKARTLENIPPTRAALKQHVLRATYQGGYVWGKALQSDVTLPDPGHWGWELAEGRPTIWTPNWSNLAQAQEMCHELIHCKCKKNCKGHCRCFKASLKCTALCACDGNCYRD